MDQGINTIKRINTKGDMIARLEFEFMEFEGITHSCRIIVILTGLGFSTSVQLANKIKQTVTAYKL